MIKDVLIKIKRTMIKIYIARHEQTFKHLKYIFQNNGSKTLIVAFSGFPGKGRKALYNYMATLSGIKVNKLFLLDDIWNPVNVGSYYLGKDGDWYLIEEITALIDTIRKENGITQVITVGSSKGGTSALFYGIKTEADACIIGTPQYHVGKYLSSATLSPIMDVIMGDHSQESIARLDEYIVQEIKRPHKKKPEVYIHYSPEEHTYKDHIVDMIADLRREGYKVMEDNDYKYEHHSDVAKYYPNYLVKTVKQIVK